MKNYIITMLFLGVNLSVTAQTIPATNTLSPCVTCDLPGFTIVSGTTDVHDINGGGTSDVLLQLPNPIVNPPNGHTTWLSGCCGSEFTSTTITGLTMGETYEFNFYIAQMAFDYGVGPISSTDGNIQITIDGGVGTSTFVITHPFTAWQEETITFTAASTSHTVTIGSSLDPFPNFTSV